MKTLSRREFLSTTAKIGAVGVVAPLASLVPREIALASAGGYLSQPQRRTLDAAVARLIPAEHPWDWDGATAGAGEYIDRMLSTANLDRIYAGGPNRNPDFAQARPLTRMKQAGWEAEIARLQTVYTDGLAELDRRAGGDFGRTFATTPPEFQDRILESMDGEGTEFFAALYAHTMEGVYAHPVYGGNKGYVAWKSVCYQGDVHGVRYPDGFVDDDDKPWNKFGGYSPEEMILPGKCPGQGPEKD